MQTSAQQLESSVTSASKHAARMKERDFTHQQVSGDHTHLDVCPTLTATLG